MSVSRQVFAETLRDFFRPIETLLCDQTVSEILINAHDEVYVERGGELQRAEARFSSEMDLLAALTNLAQSVGRTIGTGTPILEAGLPDGSRLQAVLPPAAVDGPYVAIRCARARAFSIESFLTEQAHAESAACYLREAMKRRRNLLICGGRSSGKTTLTNAILADASGTDRLITIERSLELESRASHLVQLVARDSEDAAVSAVSVRELLRAALRMRPDCIAVEDLRGCEAVELIQSMSSAGAQFVASISVSRPIDALYSLEALVLEGGLGPSASIIGETIASALDVIVQVVRAADGSRNIAQIAEVDDWTRDTGYRLHDVLHGRGLP